MADQKRVFPTTMEVRDLVPGDEDGLSSLLSRIWGKTVPKDYWRWKYFENPLRDHYSVVGIRDGTIVAFVGGIPNRYRLMKQDQIVVQQVDWEAAFSLRTKGLFLKVYLAGLERMKAHGVAFHIGFANVNSLKITLKRLGGLPGFAVPRMDRPVNLEKLYRLSAEKPRTVPFASWVLRAANRWHRHSATRVIQLREIKGFDDRFDQLWNNVRDVFPITTVRDSEYLGWRYTRHPVFKYQVVAAEEGARLLGFIVFRDAGVDEKGIRRGYIVDLLTVLDQPRVWTALIGCAVKNLIEAKVDIITCWMLQHLPYYRTLRKFLFFERKGDLRAQAESFLPDLGDEFLNQPVNRYLTMGDSDIF